MINRGIDDLTGITIIPQQGIYSGNNAFTPSNLTPYAWYDSYNIGSITKNGSNLVSQWNDISGNGLNALQATDANKFTYTASALNGKPGMLTGSPTFMRAGTNAQWPFLHNGTGCTVFIDMIITPTQTNNLTCMLSTYDGAGSHIGFSSQFLNVTGQENELRTTVGQSPSGGILNTKSATGTITQLQNLIVSITIKSGQTPTDCAQYISNVYQVASGGNFTDTPSAGNSQSALNIGDFSDEVDSPFTGYLREIIIYNRGVTSAEQLLVYNYLNTKWS